MNGNNFLPLWYRKRINEKRYFRFKISLCVLLILVLFGIIKVLLNYQTISGLDKEINQMLKSAEVEIKKNNFAERDKKEEIYTLKMFIYHIPTKEYLQKITIQENKIQMEGVYPNNEKLNEAIEYIEKSKKFHLIDLEVDYEKDEIKLKLILEVKQL